MQKLLLKRATDMTTNTSYTRQKTNNTKTGNFKDI